MPTQEDELLARALRYRRDNLRETTVGFGLIGELVERIEALSRTPSTDTVGEVKYTGIQRIAEDWIALQAVAGIFDKTGTVECFNCTKDGEDIGDWKLTIECVRKPALNALNTRGRG